MSGEETFGAQDGVGVCVVCGKALKAGEHRIASHESGTRLPLCCPLCMEAYQKDSKPYLERLAKQMFQEELRRLTKPKEES